MAVVLDYGEPVTHNQLCVSPDGILSFSMDGLASHPRAAILETTYERSGKRPKVIHRTPLDVSSLDVDPNLVLERFRLLLALDTNTARRGNTSVSVTCIVQGTYTDFGPKVVAHWEPKQIIEFRNVSGPPENVAWQIVIEDIVASPGLATMPTIGIVVDSDLGRIPAYNARELPLCGDFFLPPRFELLYASSDTGSEFVANRMIARADQASRALLRQIIDGKVPDDGLESIDGYPFTHYRTWVHP